MTTSTETTANNESDAARERSVVELVSLGVVSAELVTKVLQQGFVLANEKFKDRNVGDWCKVTHNLLGFARLGQSELRRAAAEKARNSDQKEPFPLPDMAIVNELRRQLLQDSGYLEEQYRKAMLDDCTTPSVVSLPLDHKQPVTPPTVDPNPGDSHSLDARSGARNWFSNPNRDDINPRSVESLAKGSHTDHSDQRRALPSTNSNSNTLTTEHGGSNRLTRSESESQHETSQRMEPQCAQCDLDPPTSQKQDGNKQVPILVLWFTLWLSFTSGSAHFTRAKGCGESPVTPCPVSSNFSAFGDNDAAVGRAHRPSLRPSPAVILAHPERNFLQIDSS